MSLTNFELIEIRTQADGVRGVFSRVDIAKGTIIGIFDGRAVALDIKPDGKVDYAGEDPNMLIHLALQENKLYALSSASPNDLVGIDFTNHSCTPNCYVDNTLVLRAKTDIPGNAELTWDYRESDLIPQGFPCWCEEAKCIL